MSSDRRKREILQLKAEQGDRHAAIELGRLLLLSAHFQERSEGIRWLEKTATEGFAEAEFALGEALLTGEGATQDGDHGRHLIQTAARKGFAPAECWVGEYFLACHDPRLLSEAKNWLTLASQHGHARAMALLGNMYASGHGVSADANKALTLLGTAAESGEAMAIGALGALYLDGALVPQDIRRGASMLHRAAAHDPFAHVVLARHYRTGKGLKKKISHAIRHYELAVKGGVLVAQVELAEMIAAGECGAANPAKAFELYLDAARAGHPGACFTVGTTYFEGAGPVKPNHAEAKRWLTRAAELGHNLAYSWLKSAPWD